MTQLPYDKKSKESIFKYALNLIHKSFLDVLNASPIVTKENIQSIYDKYNNTHSKGGLGNFLEEYYFLYRPNSISQADFSEAGVELKVTPYLITKSQKIRAKERLVLNKINYNEDYKLSFEESNMYKKCSLLLLVYYLYEENKKRMDLSINYVNLFNFPKEDLPIIENDYYNIIDKIASGKADELSESDTLYLAACTKGKDSSSKTTQPFSKKLAKTRAFCLKQSYMTHILNSQIINKNNNIEPIIKDTSILNKMSLEYYIIDKLSNYYNYSIDNLIKLFNIKTSKSNKAINYYIAKSILGVVNERIEEFEKANIQIKTIKLNKNGYPKEHMSFPSFKYNEIIKEEWETSDLNTMLSTTKYLFMIYKEDENKNTIFKKAMFWNIPYNDLEGEIKLKWLETINKIKSNNYNDLPKSSESHIIHVRPHSRNAKDTYPTPDGKSAIKRCFWLNKEYIKKQIGEF